MRIVFDTNVLIAAFISHGACNELSEHCELKHHLVLTDFILEELEEKLIEILTTMRKKRTQFLSF